MPGTTLDDYQFHEVDMGRKRVGRGVEFFNLHFPGWQERIMQRPRDLYMWGFDRCAAALAAKGLVTPQGKMLWSHGDVCRAYPDFDPKGMGCMPDFLVSADVLGLCWLEAAAIPPPSREKLGWAYRFYHRWRLWEAQKVYGHDVKLAY